jgi:ubiquinone/menaquinone biosynthesis C-methylase UbiE
MWFLSYRTLIDPLLKDVRTFVTEFAGMNPGDRVLDVCCGTGAQVLEYGRHGIISTGIDFNPVMLRMAKQSGAEEDLDCISFQLADAANLPFRDNYFDHVSVSFGLHDKVSDVRFRVVSEMKRVVKQQGTIILIDYQVPLPGNAWALLARSIELMVGDSHYAGFKDYLGSGGIQRILEIHNLQEEQRAHMKSGLIVIVKAKRM